MLTDVDLSNAGPDANQGPATAGRLGAGSRLMNARLSRHSLLVNGLRLLVLVLALSAWQTFSGTPGDRWTIIDQFYVSRPTEIWSAIQGWLDEGILVPSILATFRITLVGFAVGASTGVLVGLALGTVPLASAVFRPYLAALNSIPRLALVPLFLLWFGLGDNSKLAVVVSVVFFLAFYNTYAGVEDVDDTLIDSLKLMNAKRRQILSKVIVPSTLTWIIAGLRVSLPYALVAAVTAEMLSANRGMGYLIVRSSGQFYTAGVFAGIVILMAMAMVMIALIGLAEGRLLRWKKR